MSKVNPNTLSRVCIYATILFDPCRLPSRKQAPGASLNGLRKSFGIPDTAARHMVLVPDICKCSMSERGRVGFRQTHWTVNAALADVTLTNPSIALPARSDTAIRGITQAILDRNAWISKEALLRAGLDHR